MNRFAELTKFIEVIEKDEIGEWIFDKKSKGTLDDPIQMPWFSYSPVTLEFIQALYDFNDKNDQYDLYNYGDILEKNGIEWADESMANADVSSLGDECVLALLMGVIRADRFCEGALASFLKNGCIVKWLSRLKELDD